MVRSPATLDRLEAIYTIWMELADLLDFVLLATAVLLVSRDNNLLGVRTYYGDDTDREPRFWLIICIYWLVCLAWDVAGGVYIGDPFAWQMIPFWFFLPLAVISVFSRWTPRHWITNLARPAVAVLAAAYLLMFKAPEMARPQDAVATHNQDRAGGAGCRCAGRAGTSRRGSGRVVSPLCATFLVKFARLPITS